MSLSDLMVKKHNSQLAENVLHFAEVDADILDLQADTSNMQADISELQTDKAEKTETNALATGKVDKNGAEQITYSMLAQEVKTAITGGSAAVVGIDGVNKSNVANKAMFIQHLSDKLLTELYKENIENLYDIRKTTKGSTNSIGVFTANANYVSLELPCNAGDVFYCRKYDGSSVTTANFYYVCPVKSDQSYYCTSQYEIMLTSNYTIPAGVVKIIVTIDVATYDGYELAITKGFAYDVLNFKPHYVSKNKSVSGTVDKLISSFSEYVNYKYLYDWMIAYISTVNGRTVSNTSYICTKDICYAIDNVTVSTDYSMYDVYEYKYNADGTFTTYALHTSDFTITKGSYFRLSITKRAGATAITDVYGENYQALLIHTSNFGDSFDGLVKSNNISQMSFVSPKEYNSVKQDRLNNNIMYYMAGLHNEGRTCFNGNIMKQYNSSRSDLAKFAILSDIHVGGTYWGGNYSKLANIITYLNALDLDFVVITGDGTDNGYDGNAAAITLRDQELVAYYNIVGKLKHNLYPLRGNHDAGVKEFTANGVIKFNGVKLIYFFADYVAMNVPGGRSETVWSSGVISTGTLAWIESQLNDGEDTKKVLMCHYAIATDDTYTNFKWWIQDSFTGADALTYDGHRDDLLALAQTYGVKLYISGHEHMTNYPVGTAGVLTNVSCGSAMDRFAICTISESGASFDVRSSDTLNNVKTVEVPLV